MLCDVIGYDVRFNLLLNFNFRPIFEINDILNVFVKVELKYVFDFGHFISPFCSGISMRVSHRESPVRFQIFQ